MTEIAVDPELAAQFSFDAATLARELSAQGVTQFQLFVHPVLQTPRVRLLYSPGAGDPALVTSERAMKGAYAVQLALEREVVGLQVDGFAVYLAFRSKNCAEARESDQPWDVSLVKVARALGVAR